MTPTTDPFAAVERFCLFVGYPRSGHSLVGSLLDAHPEVVIAHEANAPRLAAQGLARAALFERLVENAREQAARPGGRRASGYSYLVPGQWQGRFRRLRVLGDKSGGKTTARVGRDPAALERLAAVVGAPLVLVHVVRNPYDAIAQMALRRAGKGADDRDALELAIATFARLAATNAALLAESRFPILTVRHESFVERPEAELGRLCAFVGVEAERTYVADCARIVFPAPRASRALVRWQPRDVETVADLIARHGFLRGYAWRSGAEAAARAPTAPPR